MREITAVLHMSLSFVMISHMTQFWTRWTGRTHDCGTAARPRRRLAPVLDIPRSSPIRAVATGHARCWHWDSPTPSRSGLHRQWQWFWLRKGGDGDGGGGGGGGGATTTTKTHIFSVHHENVYILVPEMNKFSTRKCINFWFENVSFLARNWIHFGLQCIIFWPGNELISGVECIIF